MFLQIPAKFNYLPVSNPTSSYPCHILICQTNPSTTSSDVPRRNHSLGEWTVLPLGSYSLCHAVSGWTPWPPSGHTDSEGCVLRIGLPRAKFRPSPLDSFPLITAGEINENNSGYSCKPKEGILEPTLEKYNSQKIMLAIKVVVYLLRYARPGDESTLYAYPQPREPL